MTSHSTLVVGATGFIGTALVSALRARGDQVWIWARRPAVARRQFPEARVVATLAEIPAQQRIDALVNLAGAPVVGPPWTASRRQLLIDSRVQPTRALAAWNAQRTQHPAVMISASAIGYYGTGGERWLDEHAPPTDEFQSRLCQLREAATIDPGSPDTRVVNLRLGLVLGAHGGIFRPLSRAATLGGAAVLGDGQQWMSWVHLADVLRAIQLAMDAVDLHGALNVVAPEPVRQRDFQRTLTRALRRPLLLRVPAFVLRAALGEMSDLLLRSQRVAPGRLRERGFEFAYPTLDAALDELLRRARS